MQDSLDKTKPIRPIVRTAPIIVRAKRSKQYGEHHFSLSRVARVVTQIKPIRKKRIASSWRRKCQTSKTRTWYLNDLHRMLTRKIRKDGVSSSVLGDVNDAVNFLLGHKKRFSNPQHDPTAMYLHDVGYKTLLTAEQEYQLALLVEQGNEEAKRIMIESNLRLVVKIAKGYFNRGVPFMDLIEEGNLGLIHAVDKFEPNKGFRFSTYATWWIRQNIERAIMCHSRNVRIPVHVKKEMNVYLKAAARLSQELDHEPTYEEIAKRVGKTKEQVRRVLDLNIAESSLDKSLGGDAEASSLMAVVPDEKSENPCDITLHDDLKDRMGQWLTCLDKIEQKVVTLRYGLDESVGLLTLQEVGDKMHMTRERVRQVQMTALKKLHRLVGQDGIDDPYL